MFSVMYGRINEDFNNFNRLLCDRGLKKMDLAGLADLIED